MPTARAIRPDSNRDPVLLLPSLPIAIGVVLSASLPAEGAAQAGIPITFPAQHQHTLCRPLMPTQKPKPTQMFHPAPLRGSVAASRCCNRDKPAR